MEQYELELSPEDIGEIVSMIRIQHLRMHSAPFAEKISVKEKVLLNVEDGLGPHGILVLKKINQVFDNVEITINVKLK
jgi:hypothetical protein